MAYWNSEEFVNYYNPRRQFGDFYCVVCDAQMDTQIMFGNHMRGSRHTHNLSKYKFSDEEPIIQELLDRETGPIAGLDHIWEITLANELVAYQCFLCSVGLTTSKLIIEHLMGLKHQMTFLKEHRREKYSFVHSLELPKSDKTAIVQHLIYKYVKKHGRGKMTVLKAKVRYSLSYERKKYDDYYDKPPLPKYARYSDPLKHTKSFPPEFDRENSRHSPHTRAKHEKLRDREYIDRSYYSDEETLKPTEPKPANNGRASEVKTQDSKIKQDNHSKPASSFSKGIESSDLEIVFEKTNKNSGTVIRAKKTHTNADQSSSIPLSYEVNNVSDILLRLVENASTEVFLQLALVKLDKIDVKKENELKLLERVTAKASKITQDAKKKFLPSKAKSEFLNESIISSLNDIVNMTSQSKGNLKLTQKNDLIENVEGSKTTVHEGISELDSKSNCLKSSEEQNNKPISSQQLKNQKDLKKAATFDSEWILSQLDPLPFQMFSSTPQFIPGLSLIEESVITPSVFMS